LYFLNGYGSVEYHQESWKEIEVVGMWLAVMLLDILMLAVVVAVVPVTAAVALMTGVIAAVVCD
jgi:hypothetical protein